MPGIESLPTLWILTWIRQRTMSKNEVRPLHQIANEIGKLWPKMFFGAVPYWQAMRALDKITDKYGADDARSIVLYFLSNATTWRGEDAKRIKAELKAILK